ncbi:MAG: phospholipid carrier-dependent glycosyltransferase, partial [Patescibacteria group bacterium]
MSNKSLSFILLGVSLVTHFAFFGRPNQTVFDEVHFGKFISGYYTHEYYFDIHPPLGKLMIAGFAKIFKFSAEGGSASGGSFAQIGEQFSDNKYMALRFLPSLAGTLLPVVIFLLALQLK